MSKKMPWTGLRSRLMRYNTDLARLSRSGRVSVGNQTYGDPKILTFMHDETKLSIGSYTSIAYGVVFVLGGGHPTDRVTTFPLRIKNGLAGAGLDGYPSSRGDINVGSDVWIAANATILSGVTIGHGAVVGAGAVVTRSVPPFTVVVGSPAVPVRQRFEAETIQRLLEISWWDWPHSDVLSASELLCSSEINEFIDKYWLGE